jgi:hypothetical protein
MSEINQAIKYLRDLLNLDDAIYVAKDHPPDVMDEAHRLLDRLQVESDLLKWMAQTVHQAHHAGEQRVCRMVICQAARDFEESRVVHESAITHTALCGPGIHPEGWRTCPACGDYALDGKATCGRPGHRA